LTVYVDASVIVRFVLEQPGCFERLEQYGDRVTSRISEVECLRAVEAARLRNLLSLDEAADRRRLAYTWVHSMDRLAVTGTVLRRAGDAYPLSIKSLDALHLASALVWRERRAADLVFATHDRQQGRLAAALGFPVVGV